MSLLNLVAAGTPATPFCPNGYLLHLNGVSMYYVLLAIIQTTITI